MNSPQVYFARYDSPVQADSIADDLTVEVAGDKTDWWYSAVNADDAWEEYAKYFSPITVGVIDNAIDVDNADLSGKVSFPDAQYRADNDAEIKAGANDHGTKVSQVFIGRDDDFGVTGIAHNANIVFVSKESETLPDTEEWRSSVPVLYSVSRLVESGAKVINCSFGITVYGEEKFKEKYSDSFSSYSEYSKYVMDMSTDYAELAAAVVCELIENGMEDFIIVQSAGNGLDNTGETGIPTVLGGWWRGITEANSQSICKKYGISYDKLDDHILIAGSITDETPNPSYQMHLGCSYGDNVDIYAPGVNIFQKNDGGTSFSAPMVSGVAALVWSVDPSLTSAQVKDTLLSNHSKYASGIFMNKLYQKPVVDAYEAVKAIVSDTYTLKGKIINSATNKPVSDASISYTSKASGKVISTTSREDGSFELTLTAQPGSEESIVFKKKSYYDDSKKIAFSDAQVIDLGNIVFKPMVILEVPEAVATLLGKTVDSSSGSSIEGANISILDTNDSSLVTSATSTSNGDFKIELKSSGTYDIEISKEGYSTIVQSNTYIPSGNTNIGNIEMTVNKTEFAGGKGTKDDPYQIATAAQLNAVRTDLDAHYIQTKDISLAEYSNWEPIGTDNGAFSYEDTGFCGNYNGNGHTISDLTIKDNISVGSIGKHDGYAAALFGVSDSCYIEQVILEDVNIDIDATEGVAPELIAIGGILAKGNTEAGAGSSNTIFACTVASGTISFYNAVDNNGELYIGGLSAIGFGASSENYATINVTGLTSVQGPEVFCGGISALAASAHTCENYGDIRVIIPSSICCGGITGLYTSGGWMYYCNNYGDIFVASDDVSNRNVYAGGIFGGNYANPQVFMCKDYAGVTVGQIS